MLVPYLAHAGLALSIGLGALLNATWLYVGLVKKGRYTPLPGWGLFGAKVLFASLVLAGFLTYATHQFDWLAGRQQALFRLGMMALVLISSAALYFGCLRISGLRLKSFLRR